MLFRQRVRERERYLQVSLKNGVDFLRSDILDYCNGISRLRCDRLRQVLAEGSRARRGTEALSMRSAALAPRQSRQVSGSNGGWTDLDEGEGGFVARGPGGRLVWTVLSGATPFQS